MFRYYKETFEDSKIQSPKLIKTVNKWKDHLSLSETNVSLFNENKNLHIVTQEINEDINYIIPVDLLNEIIHEVKISDKIANKSFGYIITKNKVCICLHSNDSHTYYTVNEDELAFLLYNAKAYILITNQKNRRNKIKQKTLNMIKFPKAKRSNCCFVLTKQQLIRKIY